MTPGQLATNNLELVVPGVPEDAQVWEVSPGDVHALQFDRVAGGVKVVVPEFGLTTALVFTANNDRAGQLQLAARRMRRLAAQWSYELAAEELKKVERINSQLEELGHPQPDGQQLLAEARKRLDSARQAFDRRVSSDDKAAYTEAQRALRPLRILMRAHWEDAVKAHAKLIMPAEPLAADANRVPPSTAWKKRLLESAVSSPYALSFYTLPRHWQFLQELQDAKPGPNALTNGDFELPPTQAPEAWTLQEVTLDEVDLSAERVAQQPKEGHQCLKLQVKARDPKAVPVALERTFLAISSPAVKAPPGCIVQISGWVRIPEPIQGSVDGALLFDSIGGEPLAVRLTGPIPWRKFTLHRRVPSTGVVSVTMALTGIGTAYFDDIRVEPLYGNPTPVQATTVSKPVSSR